MKPIRIQRKRTKGWRMPPNTIYVGRTAAMDGYGVFGNPFVCVLASHCCRMDKDEDYCCVDAYREYVMSGIEGRSASTGTLKGWIMATHKGPSGQYRHRDQIVARLPDLRGKNLACYCGPDRPCHADVLLELANK